MDRNREENAFPLLFWHETSTNIERIHRMITIETLTYFTGLCSVSISFAKPKRSENKMDTYRMGIRHAQETKWTKWIQAGEEL